MPALFIARIDLFENQSRPIAFKIQTVLNLTLTAGLHTRCLIFWTATLPVSEVQPTIQVLKSSLLMMADVTRILSLSKLALSDSF